MITVTSYNEDWPKRFKEIRDCLVTELAGEGGAVQVEHVGSTAVPGLVVEAGARYMRRRFPSVRYAVPHRWAGAVGLHPRNGSRAGRG